MNEEHPVALITGGGQGIGARIAWHLAEMGLRIAVCGRTRETLEATAAALEGKDHQVLAIVADVASPGDVETAVAQTRKRFDRIDVLVNNAGIAGPTAAIADTDLAEWDRTLAVNLTGAFLCARAIAPEMIARRRGKIINISSMAGKLGYPLRAPYAASKWGMIGLSHTLAKELGPHNIQVNTVCPGPIAGDRMDRVIKARAAEMNVPVEEVTKAYVAGTALGRMATENDVAALVAYLVSPAGDNITGQAIDVAAGYGV